MSGKTCSRSAAMLVVASLCVGIAAAQTVVKPPKNKYTPQQDVEIGREAAAQVRRQYPIIDDARVAKYLSKLGDRLVAASPPELNEAVYEYSFTPVNLKEINAFALPGGPMFVHRGMVDAAESEAEVVGVMAHELSHVLLRHGTANMTKAQSPWLTLGQLAGVVGGAVVGGAAGSAIAQTTELGVGAVLLRYSRDYEKQADLMGAQIMARAGYDPRALAHMFETIESQSKSSGGPPEWLSDHPDPGNRTQYISKEADALTIASAPDMSEFAKIKAEFAALGPAKSTADLTRRNPAAVESGHAVGTPGQPLPRPSLEYRPLKGGNVFEAAVPADWTSLASKTDMKVVPQNGYSQVDGRTVFTCGVEFGIARTASRDLRTATNAFLDGAAQSNRDLRTAGPQYSTRISQRAALGTPLVNRSALGGQERIFLSTTFLADGSLFYYLTVVPESDADAFQEAFRHIGDSIRLTDAR